MQRFEAEQGLPRVYVTAVHAATHKTMENRGINTNVTMNGIGLRQVLSGLLTCLKYDDNMMFYLPLVAQMNNSFIYTLVWFCVHACKNVCICLLTY